MRIHFAEAPTVFTRQEMQSTRHQKQKSRVLMSDLGEISMVPKGARTFLKMTLLRFEKEKEEIFLRDNRKTRSIFFSICSDFILSHFSDNPVLVRVR